MDVKTKYRMLLVRAGQREALQIVENAKRKSEEQRKELDLQNLSLQSLLYGKDYYLKEVHFCKEFKTPNLVQAINPTVFAKEFKNLPPSTTDQQHKGNLKYLGEQLEERKLLSKRLKVAEDERKEKENEFLKRQRVLEEFPATLESLEKATRNIQQHFDIKLTEKR